MNKELLKKLTVGLMLLALVFGSGSLSAHADEDEDSYPKPTLFAPREGVRPSSIIPREDRPEREDKESRFEFGEGIRLQFQEHMDAMIVAKHEYENGTHKLEGMIKLPTPCHSLETSVIIAESYPEQVTVAFKSEDKTPEDAACIQVIAPKEFEVKFQASEEASIKATLNGDPVSMKIVSDDDFMEKNRERNQDREEIMERNEERKEEHRAELAEKAKERIEAYFDRMVERINAAFERMEKLIERTESRIEKLEENGLETTASLEFVAEAKTKLVEGEANFELAVETMEESMLSGDIKESYQSIRENMKNAMESLKDSKESLKDAVRVLKSINASDDSSDETNNNSDTTETE